MEYKIQARQFKIAKKLGVEIKPSKKKKIDIYKDDIKIASIGGRRPDTTFYNDYATYITILGKAKADLKKKNYLARHAKEPKEKDGKKTNSFYAKAILWS